MEQRPAMNQSRRSPNQSTRISPNNPVVRRLPFTEPTDLNDQARVDNLANYLHESIAKDRQVFIEKYSFDTEKEVPLSNPGTYEWHQDENGIWIGVQMDLSEDNDMDKEKILPMKAENEATPDPKREETVPLLKKRRNEIDNKVGNGAEVKRRISFD